MLDGRRASQFPLRHFFALGGGAMVRLWTKQPLSCTRNCGGSREVIFGAKEAATPFSPPL
jgi:hypothetical protein